VFYKDVEATSSSFPARTTTCAWARWARLKSVFDNETWYDIALPDVTARSAEVSATSANMSTRIKDARAKTA